MLNAFSVIGSQEPCVDVVNTDPRFGPEQGFAYPSPVLERALQQDPGSDAELLTGGRLGFDRGTNALALALSHEHRRNLDAVLCEFDDTTREHDYDGYRAVLLGEGFHLEFCAPTHACHREERRFHQDGLEASLRVAQGQALDTVSVERAVVRYNWVPTARDPGWGIHGSGWTRLLDDPGVRHPVYVCSLDCRVAFRFKLARLRALGRFLWPWYDDPPA